MTLQERIKDDLKNCLKSGDKGKAGVLRMLVAELYNYEKDKLAKKPGAKVEDDETVAILQKEAKKRKDALDLFRKGGRADLVAKEEGELDVISAYLPRQLSPDEIAEAVHGIIAGGGVDFNSVMREAMQRLKGQADGKEVARIVKEKLQK